MTDGLSARPHFLYVLGNEGGPYKIGYTMNLKTRRWDILGDHPGTLYADRSARYWSTIPIESRDSARVAESMAHEILREWQLCREKDACDLMPFRREWFSVSVDQAILACHTAALSVGAGKDPSS